MATFAIVLTLFRAPSFPTPAQGQLPNTSIGTGTGAPTNCGTSSTYAPGSVYIQSSNGHLWTCTGVAWVDDSAAGGVPSGITAMVVSGSCPAGYTEVSALNAAMPLGTVAANGDIGATGGANTVTPTVASLTAAAQAFTGSSATTSAVSAGTPAGTNGTVTGPAQVISWPVGVPTNAAVSAGTPAGTNSATTTSGNTAATNIAAGTGSLTAAKATAPNLTVPAETFTGTALGTHTHTISWPAGVPTNATSTIPAETFTGSALGTHTHTLTATGTNGTSSVTGTLNSVDNRSAFVKVIYCTKS
jgi:hypothetical protein